MPTRPRRRKATSTRPAQLSIAPPPAPPRPGGRAWINGREVGGPAERIAHLGRSYD